MPTNSEPAETPEERAEAVARDLADTGRRVTARAVREAAGVRMAVAAEVARAWKEAEADEPEVVVPPVPEDVTGRLKAIWTDAYRAAVASISPERDRLRKQVAELREEVEDMTTVVTTVEAERDRITADVEAARVSEAEAKDSSEKFEREARGAESRATAVEGERDRLAAQIAALIERIPTSGRDNA